MTEVWSVEVSTSRGHKVYHAALKSKIEAKKEVLKINGDEDPLIESIGRAENIHHLKQGTCRQVLP